MRHIYPMIFFLGPYNSRTSLKARYPSHPFLDYVSQYLSFHLKTCDEVLSIEFIPELLQPPAASCYTYKPVTSRPFTNHDGYPKFQGPLCIAAGLGHYALCEKLLYTTDIMTQADGVCRCYRIQGTSIGGSSTSCERSHQHNRRP